MFFLRLSGCVTRNFPFWAKLWLVFTVLPFFKRQPQPITTSDFQKRMQLSFAVANQFS